MLKKKRVKPRETIERLYINKTSMPTRTMLYEGGALVATDGLSVSSKYREEDHETPWVPDEIRTGQRARGGAGERAVGFLLFWGGNLQTAFGSFSLCPLSNPVCCCCKYRGGGFSPPETFGGVRLRSKCLKCTYLRGIRGRAGSLAAAATTHRLIFFFHRRIIRIVFTSWGKIEFAVA